LALKFRIVCLKSLYYKNVWPTPLVHTPRRVYLRT